MLFEFLSLDYVFLRCWTIFSVEFNTFFLDFIALKSSSLTYTHCIHHTQNTLYSPSTGIEEKHTILRVRYTFIEVKGFQMNTFSRNFAAHLFIVRHSRVIILANNNEYAHTFLSNFTTVNKAPLVHSKNHWYLTIGNSVVWKSKPYEVMRNIVNDVLNEKWH